MPEPIDEGIVTYYPKPDKPKRHHDIGHAITIVAGMLAAISHANGAGHVVKLAVDIGIEATAAIVVEAGKIAIRL